jgi:NADH dehydrogenase
METNHTPRIVIVGAGFGGLQAALHFSRLPVHVTLIDRRNYHTFQPLLYQVATAGLSPGEIAAPIRWIVRGRRNIEVLLGEVQDFDLARRRVKLPDLEVSYDYLIVAAGASHAYFGHDEWEPFAPGLKTIEDALEIRRRVLLAFELAEREMVETGAHPELNFVIIGGGPTGVELAGAISDISKLYMRNDFRHIDPARARVILIEGSPRILAAYPEDLSKKAVKQLAQLGVEVHAGTSVTEVQPGYVVFGGQRLDAVVTLWAAGVQASPLGKMLCTPTDKRGCAVVDLHLNPPGRPEIFVCGDLAHVEENGRQVPGVAQPAMQMGRHAAKMIGQDIAGKPRTNFHYFDKGDMATIGRHAAVANVRWPVKAHWTGTLAWLSWVSVHLFFLVGFRNRVAVFLSWAWTYLTFNRGARLITGSPLLPGWGEQPGIRPQTMRPPMDTTSPFPGIHQEEPKAALQR